MIEISVIVTCYNEAGYISDAIGSVLNQTAVEYIKEIIVVDDGSTDDSSVILRQLESDHFLMKVITQKNTGLPGARNAGLKEMRGNYFAILDGDDKWLPDKVSQQVEVLKEHPDVGLVYSSFYSVTPSAGIKKKVVPRAYHYRDTDTLEQLFVNGGPIIPSTVVVNRKCVDEIGFFDESCLSAEDNDYWLRIAGKFKFEYIDKPLTLKLNRQNSLGANTEKKNKYLRLINNKIISEYPHLKEIEYKRLNKMECKLVMYLIYSGEFESAFRAALKLLKLPGITIKKLAIVFCAITPIKYILYLRKKKPLRE